jgi:hypothetical protein
MDGAKISVLKKRDEIGFEGLLEGGDCGRLETKTRSVVLGNLTDEALEREFTNQELSGLLVTTNLT